MSTSTALARMAAACRQLLSPKSNEKGQLTCNMNMSEHSCGAGKLINGSNGRTRTSGFS